VSDAAAREILIAGARALAHVDSLGLSLQVLLDSIAEQGEVASAAIVIPGADGALEIAVRFGLDEAAAAGLTEAMRRPTHPVTRSFSEPAPTFDVQPTVPGGPALRSHLPLIATRGGRDRVLGVLALAHEHPIEPALRPVLLAGADLAAVAIERHRPG
jgi:hypothetical protein